MKDLKLIIKGFFVGIANIIPGVSGGTLAITLGIYEKLIGCVSHFLKNFKENIKFILPLGIGMVLAILSMSHLITWSFENATLPTCLLFMGLVIGGIPLLFRKVKKDKINWIGVIIFLITFGLVMVLAFSDKIFGSGLQKVVFDTSFSGLIKMLLVGILASATMIIPGVSGSLVMMLIGYYDSILNAIKSLTTFENIGVNLLNLGFFGVGILIGVVAIAKLLEWLFKKYETITYYGVLGFISSSVIAIPVSVIAEYGMFEFNAFLIIVGIMLFTVGIFTGYKLGDM